MKRSIIGIAGLSLLVAAAPAQDEGKYVLGRYAQVRYDTGIHAAPSKRSRTYYHVRQNDYLVATTLKNGWVAILMQNGVYGYGLADAIEVLPFEVVSDHPVRSNLSSRAKLAQYSLNYIGTPYKWGGNDENNGIDCSGFVKNMYGKIGLQLPRTAAEQALVGQPIYRLEDLRPGDRLYFWDKKRGKIGHTGMYVGAAMFVHASSGHHGVATDDLRKGSWLKILVAARR